MWLKTRVMCKKIKIKKKVESPVIFPSAETSPARCDYELLRQGQKTTPIWFPDASLAADSKYRRCGSWFTVTCTAVHARPVAGPWRRSCSECEPVPAAAHRSQLAAAWTSAPLILKDNRVSAVLWITCASTHSDDNRFSSGRLIISSWVNPRSECPLPLLPHPPNPPFASLSPNWAKLGPTGVCLQGMKWIEGVKPSAQLI